MKIKNKNLLIFILAAVIILLSWSWFSQKGLSNKTNLQNQIEKNGNKSENSSIDQESPQLKIYYPGNGAVLDPGPLMVRYFLAGNLDEVKRVDLLVQKKGESMQRVPGFFNKVERTGSQLIPNLKEGEYQLIARLVRNDENYFNTPLSETIVIFMIKESAINK